MNIINFVKSLLKRKGKKLPKSGEPASQQYPSFIFQNELHDDMDLKYKEYVHKKTEEMEKRARKGQVQFGQNLLKIA